MKKELRTFYKYIFKTAAVRVSNHPEIQTKAVAEALNIHPFMLSRWKKQMREGILRNDPDKLPSKKIPNELVKALRKINSLEKQLTKAQEENKVLKKIERVFPGKK